MPDEPKLDTQDYHRELNNVKADLAVLRGDMSNLLNSVVELSKQGAGAVKDKARAQVDARVGQLNDAYEAFRREGTKCCEKVSKTVEEYPVSSVLIALGAGLLLGSALRRNNHHD